jgi:thioredoxin reductase (NADPH)
MVHKVVIIGSGPAGLTAGIYTGRAKLAPIVIDGPLPGGQLMTTTMVENWPGEVLVGGPDLMIKMRQQAESCGVSFVSGSVIAADLSKRPFTLTTDGGKILHAETIIIASGATNKRLGCPGEDEYWGKGVSVCATCDALFYQGKEVVIVGGGNSAVTEAEHLSRIASKVTIVHVGNRMTATDPIKDKVLANKIVEVISNATVVEITGDGNRVTGAVIEKDGKRIPLVAAGVFVAIGLRPNTTLFKDHLAIDQHGYLVVNDHTKTSIDGVFAAGDVADYRYRQAITSAGVGCMAALDAQAYLSADLIDNNR